MEHLSVTQCVIVSLHETTDGWPCSPECSETLPLCARGVKLHVLSFTFTHFKDMHMLMWQGGLMCPMCNVYMSLNFAQFEDWRSWPNIPADEGGVPDLQECTPCLVPWQTQPSHQAHLTVGAGGLALTITVLIDSLILNHLWYVSSPVIFTHGDNSTNK